MKLKINRYTLLILVTLIRTSSEKWLQNAPIVSRKRGFEPGHEMDDWLEAEREISNQCRYWSQG